ncbi:MAG: ATP-binding cassette domain-containing protein [Alphaproteobacteria bacterium]|nr:ATP-binding cassette domain-containing protein [Alphaproteobacteria bacterium]
MNAEPANAAVANAQAAEAGARGGEPLSTRTAPALSVEGLGHRFGARRVLADVSFAIMPGQFTVLLGLNGAGKTTLFSLATRLYAAAEGEIRIFGTALSRDPSACLRQMGVVFQQPTLDLDLSIAQNLLYHAALHGLSRRDARARVAAEIERVELTDRLGDTVRRLSGGQRRRVEIARALLHRPRLLLLDEPTVGLDIASRQFLLDRVRHLCREEGLAVLWATHLIEEAGEGARVVVLHKGEVLASGDAEDIVRRSRTPSMRAAFEALIREREAA